MDSIFHIRVCSFYLGLFFIFLLVWFSEFAVEELDMTPSDNFGMNWNATGHVTQHQWLTTIAALLDEWKQIPAARLQNLVESLIRSVEGCNSRRFMSMVLGMKCSTITYECNLGLPHTY